MKISADHTHWPPVDKKGEHQETRQQPRTDCDNNKKRYSQGRQSNDRIVNQNLDDQMRIPRNLKFCDIFKLINTGNHPPLKHSDGTARCHNYHHRGFCWPTCNYNESHSRHLTDKEKPDGRKYIQNLLGKYNAVKNKKDPILPNGTPPQADEVKISENDSGT